MDLINLAQKTIEFTNGVQVQHDARNFIRIEPQRERAELLIYSPPSSTPEDALDYELALCLPPATLPHAATLFPDPHVRGYALHSLLELVEELSHFVLTVWKMEHYISLSHLELEIQGIFDKYIVGGILLHKRLSAITKAATDYALIKGIFDLPTIVAQSPLYTEADHLGYKYLAAFGKRLNLQDHRDLYRKPADVKMREITSLSL